MKKNPEKCLKIAMIFLIMGMFVFSVAAVTGRVITVSKGGSIKKAVSKPKNGDTIYLKPGRYKRSSNRRISINKNIKISALDSNIKKPRKTIITGSGKDRIFLVKNGKKLILNGITLTNGKQTYGGAINVAKGKLVVIYCIFTKNTAFMTGGAILVNGIDATIKNSIFSSNKVDTNKGYGGGIETEQSSLTFEKSNFAKNYAASGGRISFNPKKLLLKN